MKKEEIYRVHKEKRILHRKYILGGFVVFRGVITSQEVGSQKKKSLDESYLDSLCAAIYVNMFVNIQNSCRVQELYIYI